MNTLVKKLVKWGVILAVAGFVVIQLVPYGRNHTNPPVLSEPNWDSPETRALAERACYDCHSNETAWPWYSNVAPVSWLVQHDTEEGREHLNFSEWDQGGKPRELEEMWEVIQEGEMPPAIFLPTHPEARLTPAETEALIAGLRATVRN
ncbi:MAG: heme-binding domain-containing protein [Candidatus Promineifilaceae bacterium]|nr:heme-binding domain-containing protein [Anaerolineaceae bacterium]